MKAIRLNQEEFCKFWNVGPFVFGAILRHLQIEAAKEWKCIRLVKGAVPEADQNWIDEKFNDF
ncbi:TPA: hypothetical protein KNG82_002207 [Escherichia coli]|nr:hypothetical protein [Escherichia coli]